jgi:hypothetical protein
MGDDLNAKLAAAAEARVGKNALMKTNYGTDCFVLVDQLLRDLGAATAADGDVKVTPTADYDWGDGILLTSIQPGDILQFRKHFIKIVTVTKKPTETVTDTRTLNRPHHTAVVVEVHQDGSVTVVEQNVHPNPGKVNRNVIPRLDAGEETKRTRKGDDEIKTTITVTGEVKAYRPIPKPPKGASLLHPGKSAPASGWRMLANVVPSQGGAKRAPGPLGMEVQRPDDIGDLMKKDA